MKPGDATLALRIALTIPYVWLRVRLFALPRALAGLTPRKAVLGPGCWVLGEKMHSSHPAPSTQDPAREERSDDPERIVYLTDLLLSRRVALVRPSCLLRSLVLYRFLRETGLPVRINFGVSLTEGALKGHSWLTLDGIPYAEPFDPTLHFRVVYRFPE